MPTQVDPLKHMISSALQDVTPVRLRLLLVANCLGALLFCLVSISTILQHEHAVRVVGVDAAPSVMAAQQIKIGVEQMDIALADELLYGHAQEESTQVAKEFEEHRQEVCKGIVDAAKNITFGKKEQDPIEQIQSWLGEFVMQAQRARDLEKFGTLAPPNQSSSLSTLGTAVDAYRDENTILQERLLPNADALNKANSDALETTYSEQESKASISRGMVLLIGLLLVALLSATQIYLLLRFRRRINPPLLLATIFTIVFVQWLSSSLTDNSNNLRIAKEDAYNSISALLNAKADAYAACAAEDRYLLDRKNAQTHEKYFFDHINNIARFSPGHDYPETIERAEKQMKEEEGKMSLPGFNGSMADELKNIRFPGEGEPALASLKALSDYSKVDSQMRQLERSGAHDRAVKYCLSYSPWGCRYPFHNFVSSLDQTLSINKDQFDRTVDQAFHDLHGLVDFSLLTWLSIMICVYLGLRPRMAEYV